MQFFPACFLPPSSKILGLQQVLASVRQLPSATFYAASWFISSRQRGIKLPKSAEREGQKEDASRIPVPTSGPDRIEHWDANES